MILDKQNLFSDDQAVTVTADSTNVIDLGIAGMGKGEPVRLFAQVTTTFDGGTSLKASLVTSDSTPFSGAPSLVEPAASAAASLLAGYAFGLGGFMPEEIKRYNKLVYTVVGTMTAGTITAGFLLDKQNWAAVPDGV
ncbi:MAG: hypothetical protein QM271_05395 [Bacillota bacterium]|nr:hypothetical protein [Bacillota bacterium]